MIDTDEMFKVLKNQAEGRPAAPGTQYMLEGFTGEQLTRVLGFIRSFETPDVPDCGDPDSTAGIKLQDYESLSKQPADGWIPWRGGECPLPTDTRVDVKLSGGTFIRNELCGELEWAHAYTYANIIAYRVVK